MCVHVCVTLVCVCVCVCVCVLLKYINIRLCMVWHIVHRRAYVAGIHILY